MKIPQSEKPVTVNDSISKNRTSKMWQTQEEQEINFMLKCLVTGQIPERDVEGPQNTHENS